MSFAGASAFCAAVLLLAVAAQAQPCIECKDPSCTTQNCKSVCKPSCAPTYNSQACVNFGTAQGNTIGKQACDTTKKYCSGGNMPKTPAPRAFPATLSQCRQLALDQCITQAKIAAFGSSGNCKGITNGIGKCSKKDFDTFYTGEITEMCKTKVLSIQ